MKVILLNQQQADFINHMLENEKQAYKDILDNPEHFDEEDKEQAEKLLKISYGIEYALEIGEFNTDDERLEVIKYILNSEE